MTGDPKKPAAPAAHGAPHPAPHPAPHAAAAPHAAPAPAHGPAPHGAAAHGAHRPAPRPVDEDEDEDAPKRPRHRHHWWDMHGLGHVVLAHPVLWGLPATVVLAMSCGFAGGWLAARVDPPAAPAPPRLERQYRADTDPGCANAVERFAASADAIERNMVERLHERMNCNPQRIVERLN